MRSLPRLVALGVAAIVAVALPATAAVYYYFGASYGVAFVYGVAVGMVTFASTAVTASLLTGPTTGSRMAWGTVFYVGRLGFAAAAISVPVFLGVWPVLPVLGGFAGVYVVENVAILAVLGTAKLPESGRRYEEDTKRRVEV